MNLENLISWSKICKRMDKIKNIKIKYLHMQFIVFVLSSLVIRIFYVEIFHSKKPQMYQRRMSVTSLVPLKCVVGLTSTFSNKSYFALNTLRSIKH